MIFAYLVIATVSIGIFLCCLLVGAYLSECHNRTATATVVPIENALELSHDSDRSFLEAFEDPTMNEVDVISDY